MRRICQLDISLLGFSWIHLYMGCAYQHIFKFVNSTLSVDDTVIAESPAAFKAKATN